MHEHYVGDQTTVVASVFLSMVMNQTDQDRWLDQMPYKELVWHSGFEMYRKYAPDKIIALQVEVTVLNRILNANDPPDVLEKLNVTAKWLDERL